jgi:DNA replication initiation complex subunit (GINS family)
MGEDNSTITFEAIYELVRKEKANEEIQKLNPQIYHQIIRYLKTKTEMYKSSKDQLTGMELEKLKTQIVNARKLIKELYERRERKILQAAVNKSRMNTADESNLMEGEKLILLETTQILDRYRHDILLNLINGKLPFNRGETASPEKEKPFFEPKEDIDEDHSLKHEEVPKKLPDEKKIEIVEAEKTDSENKGQIGKIKIKFTAHVPKFVGENLEILGPYQPGDVAEFSEIIAEIILNDNSAIRV